MLFIESKTSEYSVDGATRLHLLDRLQEKGLVPLIRSGRMSCFDLALMNSDRAKEMERTVANWTESEDGLPFVRGDLFCVEDFVLFLIFGNAEDELTGMRAGIVYRAETGEPERKLDAFCRNVSDALENARGDGSSSIHEPAQWTASETSAPASSANLSAGWENGSNGHHEGGGVERRLAFEALEDPEARRFLHRIGEAQADGRLTELLAVEGNGAASQSLINRLSDAGLLRREVLISCRKNGRSLFRLPSADALAVITGSSATCSECGAAIGDEKVEELMVPTGTATELLEDGSWLVNRLRESLLGLGLPEKQISVADAYGEGEAHAVASVSGEQFLFVLREGDLGGQQAGRALDRLIKTGASHLVVIATGNVLSDGRVRLREYAQRRARTGISVEIIPVAGFNAVSAELQGAFERVAHRRLAAELCQLDASLGFSAGYMIATRFRLMQNQGALKDLAESAVGALAGSLREL